MQGERLDRGATAGLHFTNELLDRIKEKGVNVAYVTLHVSPGTFTPVKAENIEEHIMEPEYVSVSQENADIINKTEGKLIAAELPRQKRLKAHAWTGTLQQDRISAGYSFTRLTGSYQR